MEKEELEKKKNKKLNICKISTFVLIGLAFVVIGLMIAWLLVRSKNHSAMVVLSIIIASFIACIIAVVVVYLINNKQAKRIQEEIDND